VSRASAIGMFSNPGQLRRHSDFIQDLPDQVTEFFIRRQDGKLAAGEPAMQPGKDLGGVLAGQHANGISAGGLRGRSHHVVIEHWRAPSSGLVEDCGVDR